MRVVPLKQIFYCFVCAAGGDVFKFVQQYHKMTPGEALRYLAEKYHVALPKLSGAATGSREARENLLAASAWAAQQFRVWLASEAGGAARGYLKQRGLTAGTIDSFALGYCPDGWTALAQAAARQRIAIEHLVDAGLLKKRNDGSPFDVFRDRVIFPIFDSGDRVIAFGGRILPSAEPTEQTGPKYLNSPESPIFNKRDMLYGLNKARAEIIKSSEAILVEGYMDVIGAHQAGVTNVIAALGTAFTEHHATLLQRICRRLVLVFDTDEAGRRAADRAIELLLAYPMDVCVLHVPDAKDPCDFCMDHGGEALKQLVAGATDALEYKWAQLTHEFQSSTGRSRKSGAAQAMLRLLALAAANPHMDQVRRTLLEKDVAGMIGMSLDEVHAAVLEMLRPGDPTGGSAHPTKPVSKIAGAGEKARRWVLGTLLSHPALYLEVSGEIGLEWFADEPYQTLAAALIEYLDGASNVKGCSLSEFVSLQNSPDIIQLAIAVEREADHGQTARQCLLESIEFLRRSEREGGAAAVAEATTDLSATAGAVPQSLVELLDRRREDHQKSQLRRP